MSTTKHPFKVSAEWEARYNAKDSGNVSDREVRTPWERDYARLIHSSAFRRMQAKTQVLGLGESDFYRTRLTHSLEVAQIGVGIVRWLEQKLEREKFLVSEVEKSYKNQLKQLLPDYELMSAICLAHDIGHPPFGHGGEVALNICMRDYGGFEGNGQSLRILCRLDKYTKHNGMNPTRRLLLGVLKYPLAYSELCVAEAYGPLSTPLWQSKAKEQLPPKCYLDSEKKIVDWILEPLNPAEKKAFTATKALANDDKTKHRKTRFKSFDTSIMELADDISYGLHDLEDAISLGLISRNHWQTHFRKHLHLFEALCSGANQGKSAKKMAKEVEAKLFSEQSYERKRQIGRLVHHCITSIFIEESGIENATQPLIKYNAYLGDKQRALLDHITALVFNKVIRSANVQQLEFKGQKIVIELFQTLKADPTRLLPDGTRERYIKAVEKHPDKIAMHMRMICDFVAGMTDEYAARFYERIYHPHEGSVFDRM
ncbi:Deoxyguanosinetriphosphate triphosphohydrolase-like protein [Oligella sp. MSHR50489EDL]|uniref:anti-phage deoxyguanosine triphosphatase n=1 Tax=Oligella sp. MSHR50489EDL TaxID=3139409 RepID=UPI003D814AA7